MHRKQIKSLKSQAGMTLVELLLVMGVGALIVVGGIAFFGSASDKNKSLSLARNHAALVSTVNGLYGNQPSFSGISSTSVANSGGLPDNMVSGSNIVTPWGSVTVAASGSSSSTYTVTYNAIPDDICVSFATSVLSSAESISVGGSAITDPTSATTRCTNTSNSISIVQR